MPVTIYDIAREAGLSHSAVSMALRGSKQVSAATRERVTALADQMGYRPNASAVNLKRPETKIIAALMPLDIRSINEIVVTVQTECEARGYQVLWQHFPADLHGQTRVLENLNLGYSDAAVMMLYEYTPVADLLRRYLRSNRPVVALGFPRDLKPHTNLMPVSIDNRAAVTAVFELLIRQGHRHIVHIQPELPDDEDEATHTVIRGVLDKHGVSGWDASFRFHLPVSSDRLLDGYHCADVLLRQRPEVTAIQCPHDLFALGFMRRCFELGLRIPEDLSLSASGNVSDGNYAYTRLTTIDMKYKEMAALGCRMLCEQLTRGSWPVPPKPLFLQAEVVLRDSISGPREKPLPL